MEDVNALELLKEELEADEVNLKVNAIHRMKTVMMSLDKEDVAGDLFKYINHLIDTECDEVIFAIAEELGKEEIFSLCNVTQLLESLEKLAGSDETVVREQASISLRNICIFMKESDVQDKFIPLVLKLATSDWFPGRVSACSLFCKAYEKAGSQKDDLRKRFLELCNEDTPIVRRAGSSKLGEFATHVEKTNVIQEILPIFRKLAQDEQDQIRLLCIESLVPLAQYLSKEENQVNTLGALLVAGEDKNWKVRLTFAKNFAELAEAFGKEITNANLIQTFSVFLNDSEAEVKDAAIISLTKCLHILSPEKITNYLLPTIQSMYSDASPQFKAGLAKGICEMAHLLGAEVTSSKLLPILLELIKDEDGDVRLNSASGLIKLAEVLSGDLLSESVISSLSQMTKDTQWRVRSAVYDLIADLGMALGKEVFHKSLRDIFFGFLTDTAASVRGEGIKKLGELSSSYKSEWIVDEVVPKLNEIYDQDKQGYLYRMCVINAGVEISKTLTKTQINSHVVPIMLKACGDSVANVRITVAKAIKRLVSLPEGSLVGYNFKSTLADMVKDGDKDVAHFANVAEALITSS
jgi:serine/threonine-protein phosphatase 2A regulatory subunit A